MRKLNRSIAKGTVVAALIPTITSIITTTSASATERLPAATCELWIREPTGELAPVHPGDIRDTRTATRISGSGGARCSEPVKIHVRMRKHRAWRSDKTLEEKKQTDTLVNSTLSRWGCEYTDYVGPIFMEVIAAGKKKKSARVTLWCQGYGE